MTKIVSSLLWLDQSDIKAPLAPYTVDFSVDVDWQFNNLQSTYLNYPIYPAGVVVDNSQGKTPVTVSYGSYKAVVNAYTAAAIALQGTSLIVDIKGTSPNSVPVYYYVKEPSPGSLGINYAQAAVPVTQQLASCYATVAAGVITIKKSSNITSINRLAAGHYQVVMTGAAADTNYRVFPVNSTTTTGNGYCGEFNPGGRTVNTFELYFGNDNLGLIDPPAFSFDVWA